MAGRRIRGGRGERLLRRRGEYLERTFAHLYDTGGMRRTHLRGHADILKACSSMGEVAISASPTRRLVLVWVLRMYLSTVS